MPPHKAQLVGYSGPGLLLAAKPGPHTITPTALTISHKHLWGDVGPDDTPLCTLVASSAEQGVDVAACFVVLMAANSPLFQQTQVPGGGSPQGCLTLHLPLPPPHAEPGEEAGSIHIFA